MLKTEEKKRLLLIARKALEEEIGSSLPHRLIAKDLPPALLQDGSAFVSLHTRKDNKLRGCIGRFNTYIPLYELVRELVVSSATKDYRFPAMKADELERVDIEISVLSPQKKISSIEEIELGRHGIYIKKDAQSGTFLPQVAAEQGWDLEEFLGYCSKHKAGLGWNGWKEADIYIFEAEIFSEKEFRT